MRPPRQSNAAVIFIAIEIIALLFQGEDVGNGSRAHIPGIQHFAAKFHSVVQGNPFSLRWFRQLHLPIGWLRFAEIDEVIFPSLATIFRILPFIYRLDSFWWTVLKHLT